MTQHAGPGDRQRRVAPDYRQEAPDGSGRAVAWGDLYNARDLGGLPGSRGTTRFGRVFRSPGPDALDAAGWRSMVDAGVRTIVDLRNDFELGEVPARPSSLTVRRHPIEDQSDQEFMAAWGHMLGSPEYYAEALERWPAMFAAAFASIADAPDGGMLIHCAAGRDRTGLIVAMLLSLVGVDTDAILDDYVSSVRGTQAFLVGSDAPFEPIRDPGRFEADVARARSLVRALLARVDVEAYLLAAGLEFDQVDHLRSRLLD